MMFTEEQANERWCPSSSGRLAGKPAWNKHAGAGDFRNNPHCIGSECMVWRWKSQGSDQGYCGIAGKPK